MWHAYVNNLSVCISHDLPEPNQCLLSAISTSFIKHKSKAAFLHCLILNICDSTGGETKPQQQPRRQGGRQPLGAAEEGEPGGSVPPPPAQSPPPAPQRHVPGAGGHHVGVRLTQRRGADHTAAGHTAGVAQETGIHRVRVICLLLHLMPSVCMNVLKQHSTFLSTVAQPFFF